MFRRAWNIKWIWTEKIAFLQIFFLPYYWRFFLVEKWKWKWKYYKKKFSPEENVINWQFFYQNLHNITDKSRSMRKCRTVINHMSRKKYITRKKIDNSSGNWSIIWDSCQNYCTFFFITILFFPLFHSILRRRKERSVTCHKCSTSVLFFYFVELIQHIRKIAAGNIEIILGQLCKQKVLEIWPG